MAEPAARATVERDGVALVADVAGGDAERTVVFLPTTGETRGVWRPIAPRLNERGWRTVAPDYRGHGDSSRAPDYSVDELCADTVAVVDALAGQPCVLVGGSIGGVIVMLLAGESRVAAAGLVLLDIVPNPRVEAGRRERAKISAALDRGDPSVGSLDPKLLEAGLAAEVLALRGRTSAAAERVATPALLMRGGDSHVIGEREVEDFRRHFGAGEVVEVAGAGHLVARDQPALVADELLRFLDRLDR